MSRFLTWSLAVPILTDLCCPSRPLVLSVMPRGWRMHCLWRAAYGAKALSCSFAASAGLTWNWGGWERGRCSGRKCLSCRLVCIALGDRPCPWALGGLVVTELARQHLGSWGCAGGGVPLSAWLSWTKHRGIWDLTLSEGARWIAAQFCVPGLLSPTVIWCPAQPVPCGFWIALACTWEQLGWWKRKRCSLVRARAGLVPTLWCVY